jgi:hypothetical protein
MANKEFNKYAANQTWDTTGGDFENLPDGDYVGILHKAEVKKSGSDYWMLVVQVRVTEVDSEENANFIGKTHFLNLMFEGKSGWNPWKVKAFFKEMNLELPEFGDIEATVQELVDANIAISFQVKTKGEFSNTKITEVHDDYTDPTDGEAGGEGEGEEVSLPSDEEVDKMDKDALLAFCAEHEIEATTKVPSKLRALVKEWIAAQATSEDGEGEEAGTDEDAEVKEKFIEFAASAGIDDINDETSIEDAKEILKEFKFKEEELSPEEIEFLKAQGLEEIIEKKAPAKATKAPSKAATPAKKK